MATTDNQCLCRQNGLDLLRIVSALAVVLIHVNALFFSNHSAYGDSADVYVYNVESIFNIITRFSVPCFVMLSGAFNLNNPYNSDYRKFYSKALYKIFAPTFLAICLFFIYDTISVMIIDDNISGAIKILKNIAIGNYYNLWFMYMLFVLYIMTPFIVKLKSSLSSNEFKVISILMILWAIFSQATSSQKTGYSIGVVFSFLGYYLLGNVLFNSLYKPNRYLCVLCFGGLTAVTFIFRKNGLAYYLFDPYTNFFSPTIVALSIITFIFFKDMNAKLNYSTVASYSFFFYIFHTITYRTCFMIFENKFRLYSEANELVKICILFIVTILMSFLLSIFYKYLWTLLDKKGLKDKWLNMHIWDSSKTSM